MELQKYQFVHVPKTGGSAVENFFEKHYSDRIVGTTHKWVCKKDNNPIIIIREPIERFISAYHYWKNGSHGRNSRDKTFHEKYDSFTIKDFIQLQKDKKKRELVIGFMWEVHYDPQTNWIPKDVYSNTIVIKYVENENLNNKIIELLKYLNIENKGIPLEKSNITRKIENEKVILDDEDILFIRDRYRSDFELWNNINNNPEMFLHVI